MQLLQTKAKRKCPVDVLPSDTETWATYEWPDEGFEAFKIEELRHMAVNQDNIPKPVSFVLKYSILY